MSGHSKWSSIKHKKAKEDAKRGKVFTKVIKDITMSARHGGGDPSANPQLRNAILAAKAVNMPADNIDRAIKKGTGELPGTHYEEAHYEAYGPGGVAVILQVLTDNKNRTTSEIRHILSRHGGTMADAGSVSWLFEKKGLILIDKKAIVEDELLDIALDMGAEDVKTDEEDTYEVITEPQGFTQIKEALEKKGIPIASAQVTTLPKSVVTLTGKEAKQAITLLEQLQDHDDVQEVFANLDVPTEALIEMEK